VFTLGIVGVFLGFMGQAAPPEDTLLSPWIEFPEALPRSLSDAEVSPVLGEEPLDASPTGMVPTPLWGPFEAPPGSPARFSLGGQAGYLKARHADKGTWFGGAQARLHFLDFLAAEASITFHNNNFDNGDVRVTQYPVQLSAMLYILSEGPVQPYILGGVGWYYTHIEYRGAFSIYQDKTDNIFGEHLGAGVELILGPSVSIDADLRYIFLNPNNDKVGDRDFDYWQFTVGLNFLF
jgi:opacity protein-like surface antigen